MKPLACGCSDSSSNGMSVSFARLREMTRGLWAYANVKCKQTCDCTACDLEDAMQRQTIMCASHMATSEKKRLPTALCPLLKSWNSRRLPTLHNRSAGSCQGFPRSTAEVLEFPRLPTIHRRHVGMSPRLPSNRHMSLNEINGIPSSIMSPHNTTDLFHINEQ